jgi:hypothetical protein
VAKNDDKRDIATSVHQYRNSKGKAPPWMQPSLRNEARVIYWDFETVGVDEGTYPGLRGNADFAQNQTPYELGMSIYSHHPEEGGKWVHKSFMFSPPPIGEALEEDMARRLKEAKDTGDPFNEDQWIEQNMGYLTNGKKPGKKATNDQKAELKRAAVKNTRPKLYNKIKNLVLGKFHRKDTDGSDLHVPVPWGTHTAEDGQHDLDTINGFLAHHGYGEGSDPDFVTHNGINFDNPIMQSLWKSDANKGGLFGKLFGEAHPHRLPKANDVNSENIPHSKKWTLEVPRHHDTAQIMSYIYGKAGFKLPNSSAVRKPSSFVNGAPFRGDAQAIGGTGMDNVRTALKKLTGKSTTPIAQILNGDPAEREAFIKELGVDPKAVPHDSEKPLSDETRADYMRNFMNEVAHTGSGDTAVAVLSLLPMLAKDIERNWLEIIDNPQSEAAQEWEQDLQDNGIWYNTDSTKITPTDLADAAGWWGQQEFGTDKQSVRDRIKEDRARIDRDGANALEISDNANPDSDGASDRIERRKEDRKDETKERTEEREQQMDQFKESEQAEEGPYEESATAAQSRAESKLTRADFPEDMRELMGDGEIDVLRWRGGDTRSKTKGRTVVILPIGNTRVAFYGSYKDSKGEGTEEVQNWVPILGAGKTTPFDGTGAMDVDAHNKKIDEKNTALLAADPNAEPHPQGKSGDIWTSGITHNINHVFGRRGGQPGPLNKLGRLINSTLMSEHIASKMRDHTAGFPEIEHMALNKRINTNASLGIISESLGEAVSFGTIAPHLVAREYWEATNDFEEQLFDITRPIITGWEGGETEGEELPLNLSHQMVSLLLDDPMNGTEALEALKMLDPTTGQIKTSWYSTTKGEQLPEQLGKIKKAMQEVLGADLDISHNDMDADMFEYDAEKSTLAVDFNRLISGYLSGDMPEGVHPKLFSRTPVPGEHSHVEFSDQITNYLLLKHGMDNLNNTAETMMGKLKYVNPMGVDDHSLYHNMSVLREESKNGSHSARVELGKHVPLRRESGYGAAGATRKQLAESDGRNPNVGKDEPTSTDGQAAQVEEYTKLFGSPYTAYHGIHSPDAEYMAAETMEELFPPRDKATTQIEVAQLVDNALDEWSEDPTTLLRELEWIRENHPEYIDDDKMRTALQDEDRKSFVGKWIDAVKIASDSGADFELVEAEKVGMKQDGDNRFMSNSHRELLRQADAKTPLVKNPPFEMPKAKKELSLGDKARQLAEGQWKKSGYYNVWRQLRNIKRDNIGRKALEAAKNNDVGAIRDLGITNTTQFMEHIGDLPVEGAAQRGLLGTLWEGKKTFRQLHEERNKPNQQQKVASAMQQLDLLRNKAIQSRVPDTTVTNAQRKAAAKNAQISFDAQASFNARVRAQMEADQSAPGVRTSGSSPASGKARFSGGASGMQDHVGGTTKPSQEGMDGASKVDTNVDNLSKSLQVLKEYLASV